MAAISDDQLAALKATLVRDFVPHLPPLLTPSSVASKNDEKNVARALAGFAVAKLCGIDPMEAAQSVVDDGNDYGIDAIYYHAATETLHIVQSKLKASSFVQDDALAFCQGLKKIISQDFSGFNANILKRQVELEDAVSDCSQIVPVVIHTGPGLVPHAEKALSDCLSEERDEDDRIALAITNYDSDRIVACLRESQAYNRVDAKMALKPWRFHDQPRQTYFGFVALADLAKLFKRDGLALFAKNIRNPLGHQTDVAKAIRETLANDPQNFVYLNNGVTALCESIEPKDNSKRMGKRLILKGVSVVNGAQTISSAAHFIDTNPTADISAAHVLITLIKADGDSEFGKSVTRARNHQNAVTRQNFAALDDEQERLRRDLAAHGIHYAYKADDMSGGQDPSHIKIDEAARALAIAHRDPRYAVWLKKEPGQLLDTEQPAYKALFTPEVTSFRLANAVRFLRYVEAQMVSVEKAASSPERLTYRHGVSALGFVLAKNVEKAMNEAALFDDAELKSKLGAQFDLLRETIWALIQAHPRSALTVFRSQSYALPLLERAMIINYSVPHDPRLEAERAKGNGGAGYPKPLFDYLCGCAPQIGNLT
jgi:hypothetical protein